MRLKLIACSVFLREVSELITVSPNRVDPVFFELGRHEKPDELRAEIQAELDRTRGEYDAVVLLFGLCGNTAVGLCSDRYTLVIPRSHDCALLLLGNRNVYQEHFGDNPSRPYDCLGYLERRRDLDTEEYEAHVKEFGREEADFLREQLHGKKEETERIFIVTPPCATVLLERPSGVCYRDVAGDMRLLKMLINGDWPNEEFLLIPPGNKIRATYDLDRVMEAD